MTYHSPYSSPYASSYLINNHSHTGSIFNPMHYPCLTNSSAFILITDTYYNLSGSKSTSANVTGPWRHNTAGPLTKPPPKHLGKVLDELPQTHFKFGKPFSVIPRNCKQQMFVLHCSFRGGRSGGKGGKSGGKGGGKGGRELGVGEERWGEGWKVETER